MECLHYIISTMSGRHVQKVTTSWWLAYGATMSQSSKLTDSTSPPGFIMHIVMYIVKLLFVQ